MHIERWIPLVDAFLPVVRELEENGEATILAARHPDTIGLAIELAALYYFFDRDLRLSVRGKDYFWTNAKEGQPRRYLQIIIEDTLRYKESNERKLYCYTKLSSWDNAKISLSCKETLPRFYGCLPYFRRLERRGLIKRKPPLAIDFKFVGSRGKKFLAWYYPQRRSDEVSWAIARYPEYTVSKKVWSFFAEPLWWFSRSIDIDDAIDLITGKKSEQPTKHAFFVEGAKKLIYQVIERFLEKGRLPLRELLPGEEALPEVKECKLVGCPKKYEPLLYSNLQRWLWKISGEAAKGEAKEKIANIIASYNAEYAIPYGKKPATIEEFAAKAAAL